MSRHTELLRGLLKDSPNPAQTLANYTSGYVLGYTLGEATKTLGELKQIIGEGLKCER